MRTDVVLACRNIDKGFPGVQALDRVSLELRRGEIHALVGENGAGKSTLMKILGGVYTPDRGEIVVGNEPVHIDGPRTSIALGIGIVYQELNLVPALSIAENIFLGDEITVGRTGFLDRPAMLAQAQAILDPLTKRSLDAGTMVRDLTIAQQQLVEIAKALHLHAKVLILDEPTAVLGQEETVILFDILRSLKDQGVSIIYISHRLDEIFQIGDRVTILRDGHTIDTLSLRDGAVNKSTLIQLMVGRELGHVFKRKGGLQPNADTVLEVTDLAVHGRCEGVSFTLKKGEILGFAGLVGAGRTDVVKAIFGETPRRSGTVRVNGKVLNAEKVSDSIRAGMGFVPEDRKREGLVLIESMKNNIALASMDRYVRCGFIRKAEQEHVVRRYVDLMNIRPPLVARLAKDFSGGNQQKMVVSKWLMNHPQILILDEPTRGIDVGAKQEIYNTIFELADSGMSILLVSSEMEEILGLCDRIIVMHEGRVTAEINRADASEELVLKRASGL
jgi:ribose transport system ATP-binding protein